MPPARSLTWKNTATHPLLGVAIAIVLLIQTVRCAEYPWHTAVLATPFRILYLGCCYTRLIPTVYIVTEDSGDLLLLDVDTDEGWQFSNSPAFQQSLRGSATVFPRTHSIGLLSRVVTKEHHTLGATSYNPDQPFSPAELDSIRMQFAEILRGYGFSDDYVTAFIGGDGTLVRFHWPAAFHDFAALLGLVVVIASTRRSLRDFRAWRERRHLANQHLCESCNYDLTGLDGALCPECGARQHDFADK